MLMVCGDEMMGDLENDEEYNSVDDEMKINIQLEYVDDGSVPYVLTCAEKEKTLIYVGDNDGRHFLLYPPSYPWKPLKSFSTYEALCEYFANLIMPFCKENVSREQIISLIDEYYEVGIG